MCDLVSGSLEGIPTLIDSLLLTISPIPVSRPVAHCEARENVVGPGGIVRISKSWVSLEADYQLLRRVLMCGEKFGNELGRFEVEVQF